MTVLTVGVVGVAIATGGAGAPAAVGAAIGVAETAVAGGSVGVAVATSAGAGAAAGAITAGTAAGATAAGAATGAAVGAGSAAAVTSLGGGCGALAQAGMLAAGPIGWIVLGRSSPMAAHPSQNFGVVTSAVTYDCWKPLLHDDSVEPSSGKLLRDVMGDPRIKQVRVGDELVHPQGQPTPLPQLFLVNVWDETYRIDYVVLPDSKLTAHATLIVPS